MPDRLVTLAVFPSSAEAAPVAAELIAAGIEAFVQGGTGASLGFGGTNVLGADLLVRQRELAAAGELLGDRLTEGSVASDEGASWTCPGCGAMVDPGFEMCWNCSRPIDAGMAEESTQESVPVLESAAHCSMCGATLPVGAVRCPACGEDALPGERDPDDEHDSLVLLTNEKLGRAFRQSILGLVLCPPLLNLASMFELMEYNRLRTEADEPLAGKALVALIVNCISLIGWAVSWFLFFSNYGLFARFA